MKTLSCSDSCHLPHSRLTDRWMSATSGAMGLSSATPVNLTHTHTLINTQNTYIDIHMGYTHTHLHPQPHAQTATPTRTPCQNLFLFTSCLHVLQIPQPGALKSVSFSVFFWSVFSPSNTDVVFLLLLFHNAFCSAFLLTCVRSGSLDIFQCVFVQRNQHAVS